MMAMIKTNIELILLGAGALLVLLLVFLFFWLRHRPVRLKPDAYQIKWQELQGRLSKKQEWSTAVVEADSLLDAALKKKHIKGRSPGERLANAQHQFTDNDGVWFGHKLRNKIDADPATKLKKADVQQALMGIRQGLKDVGALPNGQPGRP